MGNRIYLLAFVSSASRGWTEVNLQGFVRTDNRGNTLAAITWLARGALSTCLVMPAIFMQSSAAAPIRAISARDSLSFIFSTSENGSGG